MAVYRSSGCEPRPVVLAAIPTQNKDSVLSVQILFVYKLKIPIQRFQRCCHLKCIFLKKVLIMWCMLTVKAHVGKLWFHAL